MLMATAYLSLGSNVDPQRNLCAAAAALEKRFGRVELSPLYRTPAVGFEGDDFLNAAARIETGLSPDALDDWLHALEDAQGRRRDVPRFSSRTLDIDLVLYDDLVYRGKGNLELPRPELLTQPFVLRPMADIAPDVLHPVVGRSLSALCAANPEACRMNPFATGEWWRGSGG
ncbi:MAG: 2-amino-4-hydroxy-6-hydroxymethyldihydropteridine diphosphokinase [Rehaibacterium terrae]|uniref:2-amino-4-hydroxy-6- hydroxymethyldihydropteridine diphosphokinase n=1 Tax=Rehaibacterium terrae TaxID=1341696 RepID=UPI003919A5FF